MRSSPCDSSTVGARVGVARHALAWLAAALTVVPVTACNRNKGNAASQLTETPTMTDATGEAKCGVRASAAKPLVVEWPAAERAALEARAVRGLVPVRYEGCEMEVLTNCTAAGEYTYIGTNLKREGVKIKDADELYAQLPVGAAGLEAKLERAGQLNVDMVIIGRKEATQVEFNERDLEGRCDEATHVITGLTVGAFSFYAGASAGVGAGVKVGQIGAGASSSSEQEVLKQDGSEDACALAEQGALAPPDGCGALLRVEVVPIDPIFATKPLTTAGTSGTSTSSGTSGNDTSTPIDSSKTAKKARMWNIIGLSGYAVALAGLGVMSGGLVVRQKGSTTLGEMPQPGDEKQKAISQVQIGNALLWGGIGATAGGFVLGIIGLNRAKAIKRQGVALHPVVGPGMAGAGLKVDF